MELLGSPPKIKTPRRTLPDTAPGSFLKGAFCGKTATPQVVTLLAVS
jgi:hypothetical protein